MPTKVYTHSNYNDALEYLVQIVKNRDISLDVEHLVIVPEKYTLATEKLILSGTNGSMDCEVVTLSRMASRSSGKILSKTASVMIIKKLVLEKYSKGDFKAFGHSVQFAGFALKVFDAISQFKRCLISPEDLMGMNDLKLHDISSLYREYLDYCVEYGYVDGGDKLSELLLQVLNGKFKDKVIYIANYEDFDASIQKLLIALSQNCKAMTLSILDSIDVGFLNVDVIKIPTNSEFKIQNSEFKISDVSKLSNSKFKIQNSKFKISDTKNPKDNINSEFRIQNSELKISDTNNISSSCVFNSPLECYIATDEIDEIENIARLLVSYKKRGIKWSDMGLVYGANQSLLMHIFEQYAIPYNMDVSVSLDSYAVSVCLKTLFHLYHHKFNQTDMLSLAHNYFVPLNHLQRILFVEYVNKYAVDYQGFLTPWHDEKAEQSRIAILEFINDFFKLIETKSSVELCRGLVEWVQALEHKSLILSQVSNKDMVRVLNALLRVLDDLKNLLASFESVSTCIKVLLESLTVPIGILPHRSDAVSCGPPENLRGLRKKVLFVSGINEGAMPQYMVDSGMIGDNQVKALRKAGIHLSPLTSEINQRARLELDNLIMYNPTVYLSCVDDGVSRPAYYFKQLNRKREIQYTNFATQMDRLNDAVFDSQICSIKDDVQSDSIGVVVQIGNQNSTIELDKINDVEQIGSKGGTACVDMLKLHLCNTRSATKMLLSENLKNNELKNSCYYALKDADTVGSNYTQLVDRHYLDNIEPTHIYDAGTLMTKGEKVSASRIEQFMLCPHKHFLRYGLGIKEIEKGGTRPADIGSFLHSVLEEFVKQGCKLDDLDRIVEECLQLHHKLLLEANTRIRVRAELEAKQLCNVVYNQLETSSFEPLGTEIEFGLDKEYKGIDYDGITLQGKVDRIDVHNGFIRLIDYKSGKADFSHKDLYLGKKVQLMLYLYVFLQSGFRAAGSFYFPAKTKWDDDEFSYQLKGVYNVDPDIVLALDNALNNCTEENTTDNMLKSSNFKCSVVWDKKTQQPKIKPQQNKGVPEEIIIAMAEYSHTLVKNAIKNILTGYIKKSPLMTDSKSPCATCEYKSVCLSSGEIMPREYGGSVSKAEVYCE